jgi:hypothetical protein
VHRLTAARDEQDHLLLADGQGLLAAHVVSGRPRQAVRPRRVGDLLERPADGQPELVQRHDVLQFRRGRARPAQRCALVVSAALLRHRGGSFSSRRASTVGGRETVAAVRPPGGRTGWVDLPVPRGRCQVGRDDHPTPLLDLLTVDHAGPEHGLGAAPREAVAERQVRERGDGEPGSRRHPLDGRVAARPPRVQHALVESAEHLAAALRDGSGHRYAVRGRTGAARPSVERGNGGRASRAYRERPRWAGAIISLFSVHPGDVGALFDGGPVRSNNRCTGANPRFFVELDRAAES